jgi:hypothetical protein
MIGLFTCRTAVTCPILPPFKLIAQQLYEYTRFLQSIFGPGFRPAAGLLWTLERVMVAYHGS